MSSFRHHPLFFSFDGIDGVGKSTQLQLFCDWLAQRGLTPVVCRDPGSTPVGERIRELLLTDDGATPIGPRTEMLLYMAARAQLVDEVIRPALDEGRVVVCDRYLLANVVYQGHAGGLDVDIVRRVGGAAIDGVHPDCTFLLDMDPEAAHQRLGGDLDRMERRGEAYRRRLRDGFLHEAAAMGDRIKVIDAARDATTVQAEIQAAAGQYFS